MKRYLTRTAKDATGPKEVRLTAQSIVKYEEVKSVIEACKAAGFNAPTKIKLGTRTRAIELKPNFAAADIAAEIDRLLQNGEPGQRP